MRKTYFFNPGNRSPKLFSGWFSGLNRVSAVALAVCLCTVSLAGCAGKTKNSASAPEAEETEAAVNSPGYEGEGVKGYAFEYETDPEVFSLSLAAKDGSGELSAAVPAVLAGPKRTVWEYAEKENEKSWKYPEEGISVAIEQVDDYLGITITSETDEDNVFAWPKIAGDSYYLPLGEGKRVPADDQIWKEYLSGQTFPVLERLSMPFWAVEAGDYAVLFIMEEPFHTTLNFQEDQDIGFTVHHEYPAIDQEKTSRWRIYMTENNPVSVAKLYRKYVMEKGSFITLEQKAELNPDVRKLYGAPFIYLWGERLLTPEDIDWTAFRESMGSPVMDYIENNWTADNAGDQPGQQKGPEGGSEFKAVMEEIRGQDYVGVYQKEIICNYLSRILQQKDFYKPEVFPKVPSEDNPAWKLTLEQGYGHLGESALIQVNKQILAANLPRVFGDVDQWMERETTGLVEQLKESGIDRAWIGLNSWEQAYAKPELVSGALDAGYLIGSYDSYHSIHEPGKEQWITARFADTSLYEQATVSGKNGEKKKGFQGVGRKLNPVLSLPAVKERMRDIMSNGLPFNSWFIDCDATGEIYDDYTPGHITTQQQDMKARLERMAYIRDGFRLVVGSEGGQDLAAPVIAFAHGIELQSFSWMDQDMKANKDSEYYIGKYYNPNGGVAEHFSKRIPIKDRYQTLFLDPRYEVPLYKLVYNDSVVTSYHWDWSTFKIQDMTQRRMVREVLYNVPPLYHLDGEVWEEYQEDMASHTAVWSAFSREAVRREMTDFAYLSDDGSVQMTVYGKDLRAVANYTGEPVSFEKWTIPGCSVLIDMDGAVSVYTPSPAPGHS